MAAAPESLSDVWSSTLGSQSTAPNNNAGLEAAQVAAFVASVEAELKDWAQLFTQVPNEHERRKDALGGALKIKAAGKRLEKVTAGLKEETALPELLIECQSTFHDIILGLLEVSFPVHEFIRNNDFKERPAVTVATQRLEVAADLAAELGKLFANGKVEPKAMAVAGKEDPLAPEVLKMLEKTMNKQKKKDKKKGKEGGAVDTSAANLKAAKEAWEQRDGRCSAVLGQEVWEGLSWHRGIFLYGYIKFLLGNPKSADGSGVASAVTKEAVSPELFLDAMNSFRRMLTAQGPVPADHDNPAMWQSASDGPHRDESARMFYHGIYTSMHLRGLKHLAELSFWRWNYGGRTLADAKLAAVINRKFVHVVKHIMPHAGWTADIEYERILEMESTTLSSSDFSNGLVDNVVRNFSKIALVSEPQKDKPSDAGKSKTNSGGYAAGAVSSTAPVPDEA